LSTILTLQLTPTSLSALAHQHLPLLLEALNALIRTFKRKSTLHFRFDPKSP
jgi:hypothetical protein